MTLTAELIEAKADEYQAVVGEETYETEADLLGTLPNKAQWSWDEIREVYSWKRTDNRAVEMFEDKNDPTDAENIVYMAEGEDTITEKIDTLRRLEEVAVITASAFLMFSDPSEYTVLDGYAWKTLRDTGYVADTELSQDPSTDQYLRYLGVCQTLANEYDVDLRTLDRALWVMGRDT